MPWLARSTTRCYPPAPRMPPLQLPYLIPDELVVQLRHRRRRAAATAAAALLLLLLLLLGPQQEGQQVLVAGGHA